MVKSIVEPADPSPAMSKAVEAAAQVLGDEFFRHVAVDEAGEVILLRPAAEQLDLLLRIGLAAVGAGVSGGTGEASAPRFTLTDAMALLARRSADRIEFVQAPPQGQA